MTTTIAPSIKDQAPVLLAHIAGYVGHRTVSLGLRKGLIGALAESPDGATPDDLAERLNLDPFYVSVWCRSAFAAGVCDRTGDGYRLAPHMDTLLLDRTSPAFAGGVFTVLEQREVFDRFEETLGTGERLWWDETSPDWIAGVSGTGTPFYTRLVPGGLEQVPGLAERLAQGCRIVDSACGAGVGVVRLDEPSTVVINNISMHECRDIDRVATNVRAALEPGGWFVISDFPFPDTDEGLRSVPGRIMGGIQFFEAQIDDQLLPRAYYDGLLTRHGFTDLGSFVLTPMHAVTYGRATAGGGS